ncbi:DUF1501 domain-containing protein [Engelhardtia mirabilis]|uniref:DUF1501 domain-containing protein n=1 Tax=Engelhardtia mirabilis TaxID=2528011 RepID=A0A518BIW3_9BACT|nr:hypothetical protein Pla133_19590 [Planctomycetes bacterium Pla133]QDV01210.1 hypothetical protein Pla86_19590 [Planctomycetes bacterium Pla86]
MHADEPQPSRDAAAPHGRACVTSRRQFLWDTAGGFGAVALTGMLGSEFLGAQARAADGSGANPVAGRPMSAERIARAKHVIFLFMYGGPSQIDTFDHKPHLYGLDGRTVDVPTFGRQGKRPGGRLVAPRWRFRPYGECGKQVSDLFPCLGTQVDKIAFLHGMYAESPIHGSALLNMNTGRIISGHPSLGSWVNYGLGTLNRDLPGYVVMLDESGGPISGAKNWTSGYMPASLQGVQIRTQGAPILALERPQGMDAAAQRLLLDHLAQENGLHAQARAGNPELAARLEQFELAYRMQSAAPEAVDLSAESAATRELFGLGDPVTHDFGSKCLLARRLVERGVRFIQIYSGGGHNDDNWDAHGDLVFNHTRHAGRTDRPIAALLVDLERRGLLDETLVVWGGEFGRQPTAEYAEGTGRDHNSWGFTMWMAGGGVKGGTSVGATDELGSKAVEDRYHVKRLHATILHLMGLDPNGLTYFFSGLDQKLVGVEGAEPIHKVLA